MTLTIPNSYFDIYFKKIGADPWLRDLIELHYGNSNRHYHNMNHIALMIANLDLLHSAGPKLYAAFMHDIIYDPTTPHSDEAESARWALRYASMTNLTKYETELACKMILATDGHGGDYSIHPDENAHIENFVRADLSIFNESYPIYYWYAAGVRKEYAHIPLIKYCDARSKILYKFLDLDYIDGRNIEWELDKLERYEEIK